MSQHIQFKYFEDLKVGDRYITDGYTIQSSDISAFAMMYDPQPFHIDEVAAEQSIFGGIIASGFQTIALCFRLFIQSGVFNRASLGGTGLDEVRWYAPVRSGDTLRAEIEVSRLVVSKSKPDRGIAVLLYQGFKQRNERVVSFYGNHYLLRSENNNMQ